MINFFFLKDTGGAGGNQLLIDSLVPLSAISAVKAVLSSAKYFCYFYFKNKWFKISIHFELL